jgi:hypothetical protein
MVPAHLTVALLLAAPAQTSSASPDLQQLLAQAQAVQVADISRWSEYRFRRVILREEFDEKGSKSGAEEMVFEVIPTDDGFDERLVQVDGRPPTPREVERLRKQGSFARHYRTLFTGEKDRDGEGGYSLAHLFRMTLYRYVGREQVGGIPCHRIDFEPDPAGTGSGLEGKIARAMAGSLWLTEDGLHLIRATAGTVQPIPFFFNVSRVHELNLELRSDPVEGGAWLPRRIQVETNARIFAFTLRRKSLYLYSEFRPHPPARPSAGEGSGAAGEPDPRAVLD